MVVYFSRDGYTKKIALEEANNSGSELLEIVAKEKIVGNLGLWWCGRFGLMHYPMEISNNMKDLSKYEKVTVCTPIWVFNMSAPIRKFCAIYSGKIKNVDYIFVHFMKSNFKYVADEMDKLLNVKRKGYESVCCRMGKILSRKRFK